MRERHRFALMVGAVALVAAACGGGTGDTTASTTGDTTGSTAASSTSSTSSSSTTTTEAAPAEVALELTEFTPADPDPLETIMPLDGVTVSMSTDGYYVFTFAEIMYGGAGILITGLPGTDYANCSWYPEADFAGDGEGTGCFSQTQAGYFGDDPYANGDAPASSVVMMLELGMDSVSITIGDTTFTGTGLRFDDGPVFVQIDPNTGGLAEPVTRRTGEISATDLYAAVHG